MTTMLAADSGVGLGNDAPALLIIASDPEGRLAAHAAAADVGARVLATLSPLEACARLAESAGQEVVHYEIGLGDLPETAVTLAMINAEAEAGRIRGVIVVPRQDLDLAAALAPHRDIELLCEPDVFDRQAALAIACAPRRYAVNDVSSENGLTRLVQLGEEVGRIARSLASLSAGMPGAAPTPPNREPLPLAQEGAPSITAAMVRTVIRMRRARDQLFRPELFADPAWDMLLDLFAARLDQQRVSVSSLCIAAAVPPTTALRWIKAMTDEALLVRRADATDGRRIFIELGAPAADAMLRYFSMLTSGAFGRL